MNNREAVTWLINISADIGKAEHSDLWHYEQALTEIKDMLESAQSQEGTTFDLISRQAAIDAAKDWYEGLICGSVNGLIKRLNALPPAQPEPKEGHWIPHESPDDGEQYECSECGVFWEFNDGTPEDNEAYFCPKCGAKMKGERQK